MAPVESIAAQPYGAQTDKWPENDQGDAINCEPLDSGWIEHNLDIERKPLRDGPTRDPGQQPHHPERGGPPSSPSPSAQDITKGFTVAHVDASRHCGRYRASQPDACGCLFAPVLLSMSGPPTVSAGPRVFPHRGPPIC